MQDCTYSSRMENSTRFDEILTLGKKIVEELDLNGSVDTLGRWMVHYISELIYDVENANAEDKNQKRQVCAEAIINLWHHRQKLPNGSYPFERIEPVLRTLENLDPDNDTPRYFRVVRESAVTEDNSQSTQSWFDIIDGLDFTAKMLIRYCLSQAIESSSNKLKKWVSLAEQAGLDDEEDVQVIRFILSADESSDEKEPEEIDKEKNQKRLKKLEAFLQLGNELASELKKKC